MIFSFEIKAMIWWERWLRDNGAHVFLRERQTEAKNNRYASNLSG